jgi:hypothetical protein
MTYEEMINLTETNNEIIEKLSLQNKWIVRQYMETCKTTINNNEKLKATINNDGEVEYKIRSNSN